MPQFKKYKLDEVVDIIMGQSPSGDTCNKTGNGIPLLNGPTEFGDKYPIAVQYTTDPKKFSEEGDILFCVRGSTTGRMNFADREYAIGRGLAAIRHKKGKHLQSFVKGLIDTILPGMLQNVTGSTFPNLSKEQLTNYEVEIPEDLPTQTRIASILSSLDDKIELNRRTNQTLEQIAQTLFKKYFVDDIDPANLPEGWRWGKLGEVSKNIRVSVNPKELTIQNRYVGLEHIPRKSLSLYDWGVSDGLESQKFSFEENQILFGKLRPYFHKVVFAPFNGVCSTDILVIEPKELYQLSFCLFHYFSEELVSHSNMFSDGTRMPRTNWETLSGYEIAIPAVSLLKQFNSIVVPMLNKIKEAINENLSLVQIRDSLLPKLMSGEIEVNIAEKELAE